MAGPRAELPSGGFLWASAGNLLHGLQSGWFGLVLRQLRFAWRRRAMTPGFPDRRNG
ncbi:MAG: hypothetical protein IMW99_06725 [Firmicutes bacterium]|nr:hypothetical protein [Bacillota bacterium]